MTLVLGAVSAAPAGASAPGLPRTYTAQRIDTPNPIPGGSFGWGISSADLTGDGKPDLLVAQSQTGPGQVFVYDGATGKLIDTINPPEKNPGGTNDETIAFVYVETMPDVGSCPGGDGPDADKICDAPTVGAPDGTPEILIGARNLKVNATDGSLPAVAGDPNIGRAYILDGRTRAVLKRIDMPQADRLNEVALSDPSSVPSSVRQTASPQFGRVTISPQSVPPCADPVPGDDNVGVGPCPASTPAERVGDLNGDGQPDLLITARNYLEATGPAVAGGPQTATPGSQCQTTPTPAVPAGAVVPRACTSGKAYAYSAAIAGTDPQAINETPFLSLKDPESQTGGEEFGGNLYRVGDTNGDGLPEFVIPARNLSYPIKNPTPEFTGVGAAFLYRVTVTPPATPGNPPTVTAASTLIPSPEPQQRSQFSGSFNGGRAVGDVGASTNPDILLPAALQNALSTDDGKMWAFNAVGGGGGATGSFQFASLTDPTPKIGGNFGGSFTGVGNLADGPDNPANEVLVGGISFDPFTEASTSNVGDLHFMNVTTQRNLMTIPHPENARGDGFGVGLTPMGDLNGDGFLDFAASAYLADGSVASQGRAYIFTSDNSPGPLPPAPPAVAPVTAALPTVPRLGDLSPGPCVNQKIGTQGADRIAGTIAGDRIFGLGGSDAVNGFQGADCISGGAGADRLDGGSDNDTLKGGTGSDDLLGGDGRDGLYGQDGADRLVGGYGDDLLAGGKGNDLLDGGPGADRLYGESGNDRIIAGSGRNVIDGGSGNDSIEARNGARDSIRCGRGHDRVHADRFDRLSGCEVVDYSRRRAKTASEPMPVPVNPVTKAAP